jgi:chemotaxis protein methyltransferase CheR
MMRSSIQDRSSLFLLCGSQSTTESIGDYILQATQAKPNREFPGRGTLESGVPHLPPSRRFAAAVGGAITADESTFFGDLTGLASLVSYAVPALMSNRCYAQTIRIWAAGCGTGQEAYSLAIALAELCPGLANWNLEIVASEADAAALTRAKAGIYTRSEVQRGLPTEWLVRHFEQLPDGRGWRFNLSFARRVTWLRLDLRQSCASVGMADIIVCHQKLGGDELDGSKRRELLVRITDQLAPDGVLILRSPESALEDDGAFERVCAGDAVVYRRVRCENSLLTT